MALSKAIDTDKGVPASYWRIVRVDFDVVERKVWFVLSGYVSAEVREADERKFLTQQPFTLSLAEGVVHEDVGRAEMYAFARTALTADQQPGASPMFAGAVDA